MKTWSDRLQTDDAEVKMHFGEEKIKFRETKLKFWDEYLNFEIKCQTFGI